MKTHTIDYSVQVLRFMGSNEPDRWIGCFFPLPDKCWTGDIEVASKKLNEMIKLHGAEKVKIIERRRVIDSFQA